MTKEELINFGEMFLEVNEDSRNSNIYEFIEKALKLLKQETVSRETYESEYLARKQAEYELWKIKEQQPSEDCVSRQAVLERINDWWGITLAAGEPTICDYIRELPPVTPTRKKGKWIKVTETEFGNGYRCSECGRFILTESIDGRKLKDFPYCHCGAEMESEE